MKLLKNLVHILDYESQFLLIMNMDFYEKNFINASLPSLIWEKYPSNSIIKQRIKQFVCENTE